MQSTGIYPSFKAKFLLLCTHGVDLQSLDSLLMNIAHFKSSERKNIYYGNHDFRDLNLYPRCSRVQKQLHHINSWAYLCTCTHANFMQKNRQFSQPLTYLNANNVKTMVHLFPKWSYCMQLHINFYNRLTKAPHPTPKKKVTHFHKKMNTIHDFITSVNKS